MLQDLKSLTLHNSYMRCMESPLVALAVAVAAAAAAIHLCRGNARWPLYSRIADNKSLLYDSLSYVRFLAATERRKLGCYATALLARSV